MSVIKNWVKTSRGWSHRTKDVEITIDPLQKVYSINFRYISNNRIFQRVERNTKVEAISYAINYMKRNPNG